MGTRLKSRYKTQIHNWSPTAYNLFLFWRAEASSSTLSTLRESGVSETPPPPQEPTEKRENILGRQLTQSNGSPLGLSLKAHLTSLGKAKPKADKQSGSHLHLSPLEHVHNLPVTKYKGGIHTVVPTPQPNSWKIHI